MSERFFRLSMIVPEADCAAWNDWIRDTLDPGGLDWLLAGLSPTGQDPATHRWYSAGLDLDEAALFANRLAALADIPGPPTIPPEALLGWFTAHTDEIETALGIFENCDDNRGKTEQPGELLTRAGLQPVTPPLARERVAVT